MPRFRRPQHLRLASLDPAGGPANLAAAGPALTTAGVQKPTRDQEGEDGMRRPTVYLAAVLMGIAATAGAVDVRDTRMVSDPAVSASHLAFAYAGDLWIADRDGGAARRLTTAAGEESHPRFSPDGSLLAFSGSYDGNVDVYVVPVEGGMPRRLTWHPGPDLVQGFTPDGAAVTFTSPRGVHTGRHVQLFTVPLAGGMPERLPAAARLQGQPQPGRDEDRVRPAARGLPSVEELPRRHRGADLDLRRREPRGDPGPAARRAARNDTDPMWIGDTVYFISDRAASSTCSPTTAASGSGGAAHHPRRLSDHRRLGGRRPGDLRAGGLPASLRPDERAVRRGSRWASPPTCRRSGRTGRAASSGCATPRCRPRGPAPCSSSAARSSPCRPRRATRECSPGPRRSTSARRRGRRTAPRSRTSRTPAASTPSTSRPRTGPAKPGPTRSAAAASTSDRSGHPTAPRSAYADNSRTLYWIDLASGKVTRIDAEPIYGPVKTLKHAWSPDSRWIVYTRLTPTYFQQVYLYSLEQGRVFTLTEGLARRLRAVFDACGKYLFVAASTDAGPGPRLVLDVQRGHAHDQRALPGRAGRGHAVAAGQGERRGEGQAPPRTRRRRKMRTQDRGEGRRGLRRSRRADRAAAARIRGLRRPAGGRGGAALLPQELRRQQPLRRRRCCGPRPLRPREPGGDNASRRASRASS